jgi:hypothetical protein
LCRPIPLTQLARNSKDSVAFRAANAVKSDSPTGGAVAQLGARLDGIEEVEGSNPFGSTKFQIFVPERFSASLFLQW